MKKLTLILTALCFSLPALSAGKYSCDDPIPYCKQMKFCEQAKFYLNQCGVGRLDRDNDGVLVRVFVGKNLELAHFRYDY